MAIEWTVTRITKREEEIIYASGVKTIVEKFARRSATDHLINIFPDPFQEYNLREVSDRYGTVIGYRFQDPDGVNFIEYMISWRSKNNI